MIFGNKKMSQFTVFCATADPKLKVADGALEAAGAGAGAGVVPKANVEEEVVEAAGLPKLKPLEGVADTEVTVVDDGAGFAGAAAAPKDPNVGALSAFWAPKENPGLAVVVFDSVETAGTECLSPKVNVEVDGVVDEVVEVTDVPKLNVEGAVGAKVVTVEVAAILDSKKRSILLFNHAKVSICTILKAKIM